MTTLRAPRRMLEMNGAALRGQAAFELRQCTSCHPPPLFTDRIRHDVGTGGGPQERKGGAFDTPSLRGLHDTAPYLHDGSAATLQDAIVRHRGFESLDGAELDDLAAYLAVLPFPQERRRAVRH
jgi:cytochrome c peroxidase